MLNIILSLSLLTPAVLSDITVFMNYDADLKDTFSKRFDIKSSINLNCDITDTDSGTYTVKWLKEEEEIKPSERIGVAGGNNKFSLKIKHAHQNDAGQYVCAVYKDNDEVKRANMTLFSKVHVKTPDNLNFVEGEALKIVCLVIGKPNPTISWRVGNETYDGEDESDRVTLETDPDSQVPNTIFLIKEAKMSDRNSYECIATSELGSTTAASSTTMVRIKDKYAALWPFLGICAEVFVLCAIILIYEKKRNKTELEESDTDQSPDQKNTPDHGKDSNLRHRQ